MCGIAGYIGHKPLDTKNIDNAVRLLRNRGPDSQRYVIKPLGSLTTCLISARLAIVDLDPRSSMPFCIGDYTVVYNGEIYNYKELREDLIKRGIQLRTESDTEVLLHYYIIYGEECVRHFEGMWAFAIHDPKQNKLFLSRDRFGEKPLYYYQQGSALYFGSEIKLLKALSGERFNINYNHLSRYLVNGYKSLNKTDEQFYLGIKELPIGSNLTVLDGNVKITKFWTSSFNTQAMTIEDAIAGVRERLVKSVGLRLRADVPLAFCLSGGIDSNAIVAIAKKEFGCEVETFSIVDPDPRYNEAENINATIKDLGCKSTIVHLKHGGFFERLRTLVNYHDGPLCTISYYVHSFLSEAIASKGFKVVLSGTAADELLTGYYDHFLLHLHTVRATNIYERAKADWIKWIKPVVRNKSLLDPELYFKNANFREHIYSDAELFSGMLVKPFQEAFTESSYWPTNLLRNRMLNELFHESIPAILKEDDLNSMMYSIENRSPFLDTELFNFCYSIPDEYLIKDGFAKYILREALKGYVNDTVRLCRKKIGFNASLTSLVNLQSGSDRDYILSDSPVYNLVNRNKIEACMNAAKLDDNMNKFFFNFLCVKTFLELADATQ